MADRPNVLFIITDSMRSDALGVNGNPICRTPNVDALAAAGTSFSRCFNQNPVCAPSRAAILTGWYPHVRGHRTFTYHIQPDEPNLLKYFKQAGYHVTAVGTNDCLHENCFPESLDEWLKSEGGCIDCWKGDLSADPVKRKAFLAGRLPEEAARDRNWAIKQNAVHFVGQRRDDPWFLYCAFHIPHPKYGIPEPWYSMYDPDDMPDPIACEYDDKHEYMAAWHHLSNMDQLDDRTIRRIRAVYYGMVSLADHYVGEIMEALEASGQADNTIVVFLSDHGDYTGDYGLVEKGETMVHDCLTNVPLVIRRPGAAAGQVRTELVETIDVLPTLLDAAGIPLGHTQFGKSLAPLLAGGHTPHKDAVFIEGGYNRWDRFTQFGVRCPDSPFLNSPDSVYGPRVFWEADNPAGMDRFACVRTTDWKYVQRGSGPDELYDLVADPNETVNLVASGNHRETIAALKDRLLEWYLRTADSVAFTIDDRLCSCAWTPEKGLY